MGFKVVEAVTIPSTGAVLANTEYTIHASYRVRKENNLFTIDAAADVYAGPDHTKKPIDMMCVLLRKLAVMPVNVVDALYTELKKNARFTGKTIVDN